LPTRATEPARTAGIGHSCFGIRHFLGSRSSLFNIPKAAHSPRRSLEGSLTPRAWSVELLPTPCHFVTSRQVENSPLQRPSPKLQNAITRRFAQIATRAQTPICSPLPWGPRQRISPGEQFDSGEQLRKTCVLFGPGAPGFALSHSGFSWRRRGSPVPVTIRCEK
jgi:hypothetical protein